MERVDVIREKKRAQITGKRNTMKRYFLPKPQAKNGKINCYEAKIMNLIAF